MLAELKPPGSARVLACNSPASRRKSLFGETPNSTRGDAYAPQPNETVQSVRSLEII
jgi:hypothetical protein